MGYMSSVVSQFCEFISFIQRWILMIRIFGNAFVIIPSACLEYPWHIPHHTDRKPSPHLSFIEWFTQLKYPWPHGFWCIHICFWSVYSIPSLSSCLSQTNPWVKKHEAISPGFTQSIPINTVLPRNRAVDLPRVFTFGVSVASNALDNLTNSTTS